MEEKTKAVTGLFRTAGDTWTPNNQEELLKVSRMVSPAALAAAKKKSFLIVCHRCGRTFIAASHNTLYCDDCVDSQLHESRQKAYRKKKQRKAPKIVATRNGAFTGQQFIDMFEQELMQKQGISSYGMLQVWKDQHPEEYLKQYEAFLIRENAQENEDAK